MKSFTLVELTSKGREGIKSCMKANLQKNKLLDDPLTVKFSFSRTQFLLARTVKEADVIFFLDRIIPKSVIGERDVDYRLIFEVNA